MPSRLLKETSSHLTRCLCARPPCLCGGSRRQVLPNCRGPCWAPSDPGHFDLLHLCAGHAQRFRHRCRVCLLPSERAEGVGVAARSSCSAVPWGFFEIDSRVAACLRTGMYMSSYEQECGRCCTFFAPRGTVRIWRIAHTTLLLIAVVWRSTSVAGSSSWCQVILFPY